MVEQIIGSERPFGAQEYINSGGRWGKEAFDRLREIVDKRETNLIRVRDVFIHQAQGMETHTKLEITPKEAYLYGVLCQEPIERYLGQQQLMAEVMRVMGNLDKREGFIRMYPQIDFDGNALLQREEASRPQERTRPLAYTGRVIFAYGQ